MGQRNIQCSYQMPLLKSGHDQTLFYQDHGIPQPNMVNHTSQSVRPEIAVPGTTADIGLNQFRNHHDMNKNQYGVIQSPHLVTNSDFAGTVPLNPDNRRQVPSFACFSVSRDDGSADEFPSFSMSRLVGVGMDEYGRHNSFADYVRASCKRKNAAMVPGNHFHDGLNSSHGSSSSLSVITEQPLWNEPYQAGFNLLNPSTATPAVYGGINALQATEGSRRNLWSRSNGATIQPDSSAVHHSNYLHQGNCIGQSAPPDNSWMAPFGNNAGGGGCSNWSNPHAVTHLQGRYFSSRDVELANMGVQGYQEIPFNANSAFLFQSAPMPNPAPIPNFHHHLAPLHSIQVQNYGQHINFPAPPYQLPLHSFCPTTINPSFNPLDSGNRFLPCPPPNAKLICGPLQQPQTAVSVSHRNLRILSTEDPAVLELPRFYGVGDVTDQHRDLRLDIDDMTYEELLALEEQIGDVSTGLTEESILQNLKTSFHITSSKSSLSDCSSRSFPENETCSICQVEYEESERLGTLNCGHKYHADCIKQWLLVKNLCPICKTSAFASDDKRDA
ncbi:Zinc finger RING/FYVE/PHD-type protein [Dioscorea alata]|uniref:Zinc finger RING/FYVE/PHD-type protein n=1 Tax=Dioscorea alata TaxID=55571 RepID=A0ACB7WDS4_DIOAL|nr:Zinc finger RING/FYVE/PHD-type protein [Dioscorea alata]